MKIPPRAVLAAALAAAAFAVQSQELVVGLSTPVTSLDPHFHNLTPNNSLATHVFEQLVATDAQQKLGPGLREISPHRTSSCHLNG